MDKYKKVELIDIGEEILQYCMEIKGEGFIALQYPTPTRISFPVPVKPITRESHKFALKTYARNRINETIFITAEGKTYMAKGEWIVPYLNEVGYTEGSYGTAILEPKNKYKDPVIKEQIDNLVDYDPFTNEKPKVYNRKKNK